MAVAVIRLLFYLLIVVSTKSQAEQLGFYFDARLNSPATKLDHVIGDWQSTVNGDYAYGIARMGSWFELDNNWLVGVEKRVNHYLEFSNESAFFYGQLENQNISPGVYSLDLSVNSNSTQSIYLQYDYELFEGLLVRTRASGLIGNIVQIARLSGLGEVHSNNSYTYQYQLHYLYGDNRLFEVSSPGVNGYGHSFDLSLFFDVNASLKVGFKAEDWLYRMYWSPLNNDVGCVARPSPQGEVCLLETVQVNRMQSMPVVLTLFARYQLPRLEAGVQLVDRGRHKELWVNAGIGHTHLGFDALNEVFNLGYQSEQLRVEWSFDDYQLASANHWQVSLGTQWAF